MKVLDRMAESFLWQQVCIDDMQFGFMPGHSTTDAIVIVYQLQEKFYVTIRHCTWPLSIWKRHSMVYPDMSSGGLFASSALMSGWCSSYRACMKTPEAVCVLVATWVKSSAWQWALTKALAWAPYCSSQFWKPSPRSFEQDVPGKTCMQMTWSSSLNRWRNYNWSSSSWRPTW